MGQRLPPFSSLELEEEREIYPEHLLLDKELLPSLPPSPPVPTPARLGPPLATSSPGGAEAKPEPRAHHPGRRRGSAAPRPRPPPAAGRPMGAGAQRPEASQSAAGGAPLRFGTGRALAEGLARPLPRAGPSPHSPAAALVARSVPPCGPLSLPDDGARRPPPGTRPGAASGVGAGTPGAAGQAHGAQGARGAARLGAGRAAARGQPELPVRPRGLPGQGGLQDLRPAHLGGEQGEAGVRPRPGLARGGVAGARGAIRAGATRDASRKAKVKSGARIRGRGSVGCGGGVGAKLPTGAGTPAWRSTPGRGGFPAGGENVAAAAGARMARARPLPRVASEGRGVYERSLSTVAFW